MYHTFQTSNPTLGVGETDGFLLGPPPGSRRITTNNACCECRRRKIRCDGTRPCGQCQWYQHPEACKYLKPTPRVLPSRKLLDTLQGQVNQSSTILSRLFPERDLPSLISLSREELIRLALTVPTSGVSASSNAEASISDAAIGATSDDDDSLEALEQAPDQDPVIDEAARHRIKVQGISDDVNGLSLSVDKQSSYVGVSSITAVLKVIFRTAPIARQLVAQSRTDTALPSRCNSPRLAGIEPDRNYLPPKEVRNRLIQSYFAQVHTLMPMIDEDHFWHTYLYSERKDSPWLALLNIVMALGSLAESTCDNEDHITYFQRSHKHLDSETFGSGSLLVVQALGLLSGYYLHWLNRPNEANALMGANLRMATALGLHREYRNRPTGSTYGWSVSNDTEVPAEIRRRTFWSLVCLDTWASMTTGRPSLGRLGPGITVQAPTLPEPTEGVQSQAALRLLPIIHNITFCKLATRIQDKLAGHSLLKVDEVFSLDAELIKWHDELPPIMQAVGKKPSQTQSSRSDSSAGGSSHVTPKPAAAYPKPTVDTGQPFNTDDRDCPAFLETPRAIMHWWYQTLRMLMHRPYLLAAALRRTSSAKMTAQEKVAVGKCRIIAAQCIEEINTTCPEGLIAGWNAVWLMYQAVMVPLVSLFSYLSSSAAHSHVDSRSRPPTDACTGTDEDADNWCQQIEMTLGFFDRRQRYSVAARKSRDVVARLYDASKHLRQHHEAQHLQQQIPLHEAAPSTSAVPLDSEVFDDGVWGLSPNALGAMSYFWDDMIWDTLPIEDITNMADYAPGVHASNWNSDFGTDWSY